MGLTCRRCTQRGVMGLTCRRCAQRGVMGLTGRRCMQRGGMGLTCPIRMVYAFNHLHHIYTMIVSQKMVCGVTFMVTTSRAFSV